MSSLRTTMKGKGFGSFLTVKQLLDHYPDADPESIEFFGMVADIKPAPDNIPGAVRILVFDQLPVDDCNEIALNQSNAQKVLKFLEVTFGSDDESYLRNCAVTFGLTYHKFHKVWGLEVREIEPEDASKKMRFDPPPPPPQAEPQAEPPYLKKRREIEERKAFEAANAKAGKSTEEPGWVAPATKQARKKSRG